MQLNGNKIRVISLSNTKGFTLVELMISLVLGLLISAAVVQIYLTNVRTTTVQKSGSELQDASVFGIQQLESHIRLANLGGNTTNITNETVGSGVVLSGYNIGESTEVTKVNRDSTTNKIIDGSTNITLTDSYANSGYLTRSTDDTNVGTNAWTGATNTDVGSDQLTIQFKNITGNPMPDCEGNTILPNVVAIERYFLRNSTDNRGLLMACDAGRVGTITTTTTLNPNDDATWTTRTVVNTVSLTDFGDRGQEFIAGVDQFKILLGTQYPKTQAATSTTSATTAGQVQYITPHDYAALTSKPAINAIKIGLIVRGNTPTVGTSEQTSFTLLGTLNTLKNNVSDKQMRTTYESSVYLRNARTTITP